MSGHWDLALGVLVHYPWHGNVMLPLLLRACVTRLRSYRVMRALFSQKGGDWLQSLGSLSLGTGTAYGTAETGKTSPKQDSGSSPPLCKSVSSKHLLSQSHSDGAQSNHFCCYHPVGVRTGLILKHMTNEHVSGWSIWYLMGLIWLMAGEPRPRSTASGPRTQPLWSSACGGWWWEGKGFIVSYFSQNIFPFENT